jgi:hypothetical protein
MMTAKVYSEIFVKRRDGLWQAEDDFEEWVESIDEVHIPSNLRPAGPKDIIDGNVLFHFHEGKHHFTSVVESVDCPSDMFKAFSFQGCRYGWHNAFVETA